MNVTAVFTKQPRIVADLGGYGLHSFFQTNEKPYEITGR